MDKKKNKKEKEKITYGWLTALREFWQNLVNMENKGKTESVKSGRVVGFLGTGARYRYKVKILNLEKKKRLKNKKKN